MLSVTWLLPCISKRYDSASSMSCLQVPLFLLSTCMTLVFDNTGALTQQHQKGTAVGQEVSGREAAPQQNPPESTKLVGKKRKVR